METNKQRFQIYKSSAGSGKTYTLVREYLLLVLSNPYAYKNVLAVTFTNKAAREMKERILTALSEIADKKNDGLTKEVAKALSSTPAGVKKAAGQVLTNILHDYANFSVSTIDSFTNKIVRTFARDLGVSSKFEIEHDIDALLSKMIDQLMDSIGRDPYVTEVLMQFAEEKLEQEKTWNLEGDISRIALTLFQSPSRDSIQKLGNIGQENFMNFITFLKEKLDDFPIQFGAWAENGVKIIEKHGLTGTDFKGKGNSYASILYRLQGEPTADQVRRELNKASMIKAVEGGEWMAKTGKLNGQIEGALNDGLRDQVCQMYEYYREENENYLTASLAYKNIYSLAVLREVEDLVEDYKTENNVLHFSDLNNKIENFVSEEPAEYIFWRLGEKYKHFLVDEFQDTSTIQWDNLMPLFDNLISGGEPDGSILLVGDTKQAIYRWRGGESSIMETQAPAFLNVPPKILNTNWRSRENVVTFNNDFFDAAKDIFNENPLLPEIYSDFKQEISEKNKGGGYVKVEFLMGETGDEKFSDLALDQTLTTIQSLKAEGIKYGDIAILVRRTVEGSNLAKHLSDYKIPVISSDSLLLKTEPKVQFLISLLKSLNDQTDKLAQAEVLHYWFLYGPISEEATIIQEPVFNVFCSEMDSRLLFREHLPDEYERLVYKLSSVPLYELVEELIRIFQLNSEPNAYLQHFLDEVLKFSERWGADLTGFLRFWVDKEDKLSIVVPEAENAVQIITIHKAKGLEFPIVILPMADWQLQPRNNSLFWAETPENFKEYSDVFLLGTQKDLNDSKFQKDYQNEIVHTLIDNINLLYVAFTRPRERLYIFAPMTNYHKEKEIRNTGELIYATITDSFNAGGTGVYERGVPAPLAETPLLTGSIPAEKFISNDWKAKIRVNPNYAAFWKKEEEKNAKGISLNALVRETLIQLEEPAQLSLILDKFEEKGLAAKDQMPALEDKVKRILSLPYLSDWYSGKYPFRIQPEILHPEGQRPKAHRLVSPPGQTILLDFNYQDDVGKMKEDLDQLASLIKNGGKRKIHKYILDVREEKLVEV